MSTSKVDNVKVINAEAEKKSRPVTVYNITNNHRDTAMSKAFADAEVKKSKAVEKQEQAEKRMQKCFDFRLQIDSILIS